MAPSHSNNIDDVEEQQGRAAEQTTSKEKGLWLAEVFNVVYRGRDKIEPHKQIGTIKVSDDVNGHYLYKVEDVDQRKPSLQQIDELLLSGPTKSSISAEESLTIDVDLFGGAFKDSLYIDDCPSDDSLKTGSPLEMKIVSEDGTGEIYVLYAVFDNAIEAQLEVKFLADDDFPIQVYGCVAASTSKIEAPGYSSMLFLERPCGKIEVGPSKLLPLSRSIVAVPLEFELLVDMHLMTGDEIDIYEDTVSFQAQRTGTSIKVVTGKKCKIEVKVCWKCGAGAGLTGD